MFEYTCALFQVAGTSSGASVSPDANNNKSSGNKRRRSADNDDLEDRVASLEKSTKVERVKELKEKVRTLCFQQDPSDALILVALDQLAKQAKKVNHEESDVFEELARQANRYQCKLEVANLCLSVLGGKAADTFTKAIAKCLKDKQNEAKNDEKAQQKEDLAPKSEYSPLHNLYPPFMCPMPYQPPFSRRFCSRFSRSWL